MVEPTDTMMVKIKEISEREIWQNHRIRKKQKV